MAVINYIWDVENDSYLMETDETDSTTAVYTNEPVLYGNMVSQRRSSATSYYHFDGLGSTRELTDGTETVTDTNVYDAWGVDVVSSGTTENSFQWVGTLGYYFDPEVDMYYIRARIYSPEISRWLSKDPAQYVNGANLYSAYFIPNQTDPSGLQVTCKRDGLIWRDPWTVIMPTVQPQLNANEPDVVEVDTGTSTLERTASALVCRRVRSVAYWYDCSETDCEGVTTKWTEVRVRIDRDNDVLVVDGNARCQVAYTNVSIEVPTPLPVGIKIKVTTRIVPRDQPDAMKCCENAFRIKDNRNRSRRQRR